MCGRALLLEDDSAVVGVARDDDVSVKSEGVSLGSSWLMAEGDIRFPMPGETTTCAPWRSAPSN